MARIAIHWTARRIRKLRIATRQTQADFAKRVGVVRSAVSSWEAGTKSPSLKHTAILDGIASSAGLTSQSLDEE